MDNGHKREIPTRDWEIPLFSGRPERETVISIEDKINLKILLHTENDFEVLLSKL